MDLPSIETRSEADACADNLPVGFGFATIITIGEVIYYGFEAWKACHAADPGPGRSVAVRIQNEVQGDGQSYSPPFFRRARHQVHRAARRCQVKLAPGQLDVLTSHMLNHAATVSEEKVLACCAEPPNLEGFPDETE